MRPDSPRVLGSTHLRAAHGLLAEERSRSQAAPAPAGEGREAQGTRGAEAPAAHDARSSSGLTRRGHAARGGIRGCGCARSGRTRPDLVLPVATPAAAATTAAVPATTA